ncbi:MAG: hypothetical protein GY719_14410 [bacterium]|nr:hypothetical protein [bacterium]
MRTPTLKQLCSLWMIALLVVPAVPALAETPAAPAEFDLRLEEALAWQATAFRFEEPTEETDGSAEEPVATEIGASRFSPEVLEENAWRHYSTMGDDSGRMGTSYGFGTWAKKRWYILVLAAVAIAVVAGDDGSDGPEDEED